jgi:hypothetical protein
VAARNKSTQQEPFVVRRGNGCDHIQKALVGRLGGASATGAALNDKDDVVGSSMLASDVSHAFLWSRGACSIWDPSS